LPERRLHEEIIQNPNVGQTVAGGKPVENRVDPNIKCDKLNAAFSVAFRYGFYERIEGLLGKFLRDSTEHANTS
jgi:hypothetical protein